MKIFLFVLVLDIRPSVFILILSSDCAAGQGRSCWVYSVHPDTVYHFTSTHFVKMFNMAALGGR